MQTDSKTPLEHGLKMRAIKGVRWSAAFKFIIQIIQYGASVALARLIDPSAFGVIAMLLVVTGFAGTLADLGMASAIIQRKTVTSEQLDTAFWAAVTLGTGIAVSVACMAPIFADFFGQPQLRQLAPIAAVNFIFGSISQIPRANLILRLETRRVAFINSIGLLVGILVSLAMALWSSGPWPLVIGPASGQLAAALLYVILGDWLPSMRFRTNEFVALARIGLYITGFTVFNYGSRNLDSLLIGKWLGAEPLAFYARAYSLMLLPITLITDVLANTLTSVMVHVRDDKARSRAVFLQAQRLITFISFPAMLALSLLAAPFLETVYGSKWLATAPTLRVLALVGMLQSMGNPLGWIYISQGSTKLLFLWGLISSLVTMAGIIVGAIFGSAVTVAIGYAAAIAILSYPGFALPGGLVGLRVITICKTVAPSLLCSIGMAVGVWIATEIIFRDVSSAATLAIGSITGATLYLLIAYSFRVPAMFELWKALRYSSRQSDATSS